MNKDQIKGKAKDIGGKIQEEVGKVTGSNKQQAEGLAKQSEGKLQEKSGDLKEVVRDNLGNR
ncbi:MAG: CsbD family protein [Massilia sp.]